MITDQLFKPLVNLEILILSYNFLGARLDLSLFRHLQKLTLLDLDYNNIIFLSTNSRLNGPTLDALSELRLRGNFLLDVPQEIWHFIPNLIQLDMSENAISIIDTGAFEELMNLKSLMMSHNKYLRKIKALSLSSLVNLEYLDISKCTNLNDINPASFGNKSTIHTVHFENNNLTTLSKNLIRWDHVRHLYLAGNHWQCDCNFEWLQYIIDAGKLEDISSVKCAGPEELRGRDLASLREDDYHCESDEMDESLMELWEIIIVIVSSIIASSCTVFLGMKLFNAFSREHTEMFGSQITYGSLYESHDV